MARSGIGSRWKITSGPRNNASPPGVDAVGWAYTLTSRDARTTNVRVQVSGTAMAVDPEALSQTTRAARRSRGRSAVEEILDWETPPQVLKLHTASEKPNYEEGAVRCSKPTANPKSPI